MKGWYALQIKSKKHPGRCSFTVNLPSLKAAKRIERSGNPAIPLSPGNLQINRFPWLTTSVYYARRILCISFRTCAKLEILVNFLTKSPNINERSGI